MRLLYGEIKKVPPKKSLQNLLVVAHPDDETLFFSGLLQSRPNWRVVCVTDGNADGHSARREGEFLTACRALRVKRADLLRFPDIFDQRLNVDDLKNTLASLGKFKSVFTHSILGEYGHKHHQDVCFATHSAFLNKSPVFSIAYNSYPKMKINLTPKQFALKTRILWEIYGGEIKRFIHFLPAHSYEGYSDVSWDEIKTLYDWLTLKGTIDERKIKSYKWLVPCLEEGGAALKSRPF